MPLSEQNEVAGTAAFGELALRLLTALRHLPNLQNFGMSIFVNYHKGPHALGEFRIQWQNRVELRLPLLSLHSDHPSLGQIIPGRCAFDNLQHLHFGYTQLG